MSYVVKPSNFSLALIVRQLKPSKPFQTVNMDGFIRSMLFIKSTFITKTCSPSQAKHYERSQHSTIVPTYPCHQKVNSVQPQSSKETETYNVSVCFAFFGSCLNIAPIVDFKVISNDGLSDKLTGNASPQEINTKKSKNNAEVHKIPAESTQKCCRLYLIMISARKGWPRITTCHSTSVAVE